MASSALNDKANGSRLSRLLVDQGTEALRRVFDTDVRNSPSGTLPGVLSANKPKLKALRYKVVNSSQWKLLYPASGPPDTKNFDVTLLTILLREISGLVSPIAGWNTMPPDSDTSIAAKILRVKLFRNKVYAHVTTTEIDDSTFENLWEKISKALVALGIPSTDVDELKNAPLSSEEDGYIWQLEEWKKEEEKLIEISLDTNAKVKEILRIVTPSECENVSDVDKLAKCDFTGNIRKLSSSFQEGTRTWLFEKLDSWFTNPDTKVMILTAGPGIGKSVFAAKVCEIYQNNSQLAACHFCKFNNTDYRNPHTLLQSLASQMCDNVVGFKAKLDDQLRRSHSKEKLSDAFRVLLNDPLYALEERDPMMIVIDALDESTAEGKCELLELISEEFLNLPKWIKILITSRPELQVQEKLRHFNPLEICPDDEDNNSDLLYYFKSYLSDTDDEILSSLVKQSNGSFLYAYYAHLQLGQIKRLTKDNLRNFAPKGIAGFYEKQFKRLEADLAPLKLNVQRLVNVLVASMEPLPLFLLRECLGLSKEVDFKLRKAVDELVSSFLPVYDDCLTVYHKSLIDWLKSDGYSEHSFTADAKDGENHLWDACKILITDLMNLENISDLKLTPALKYALKHGLFHMIRVGDTSFSCIPEIPNNLRCKIWRQDRLTRYLVSITGSMYLQCVANGLTAINEEDVSDQSVAISFLKIGSHVWCEDLNIVKEHSNCLRMSWIPISPKCIGISPNKELAAVGDEVSGKIVILRLPNLEVLYEYESEMIRGVPCCTFSPDSSYLLYGSLDSCLHVKDGRKITFFSDYSGYFESCSFSPSCRRLVTADGTNFVKLWDVSKQTQVTRLDAGDLVDDCFFSKSGRFIVAKRKKDESKEYVLTIWNAFTWQRVDRRYSCFHPFGPVYNISCFDWVEASTQSDQNSDLVVSLMQSCSSIVFQLPYGFPICRLLGNFKCTITETRCGNRYMLTYKEGSKSFIIVDLAARSVIAHRRVQWSDEPDIDHIAIVDGSIIVTTSCHILSFKVPDAISFVPPLCDVTITCCSFSPKALSLVTCHDYGVVRIWSVESCSVTQTCNMRMPVIACWWSKTSLWFVFCSHIAKIPVTAEKHVQFAEMDNMSFDTEDRYFQLLSFSKGILILKHHISHAVVLFQIVDDRLQPKTILPTTRFFDSAAVRPDGCCVLLVSGNKFEIWKTGKSECPTWCLFYDAQLSNLPSTRKTKCCITSDGVYGAVIFPTLSSGWTCYVIDLATGKVVRSSFLRLPLSSFENTVYAGSSFLIFQSNGEMIFIVTLQDFKIAAVWPMEEGYTGTEESVLGFNSKYNLIAVPQRDGYIHFVKIHGLESA